MARRLRIGHTSRYSTTYALTQSPLDESGAFLGGSLAAGGTNNTLTDMQSASGSAYGTQVEDDPDGPYDDSVSLCIAREFSPNQRVSGHIHLPNGIEAVGDQELLFVVRGGFTVDTFTIAVATLGISEGGTYLQAGRINAGWFGDEYNLSSYVGAPTITHGMPYIWQVINQTYEFWLNGVLLSQVTDPGDNGGTLTSGYPGIGKFTRHTGLELDFSHADSVYENI